MVITKSFDTIDKGVEALKNVPDIMKDNQVSLELSDSKETINFNLDFSPKEEEYKTRYCSWR